MIFHYYPLFTSHNFPICYFPMIFPLFSHDLPIPVIFPWSSHQPTDSCPLTKNCSPCDKRPLGFWLGSCRQDLVIETNGQNTWINIGWYSICMYTYDISINKYIYIYIYYTFNIQKSSDTTPSPTIASFLHNWAGYNTVYTMLPGAQGSIELQAKDELRTFKSRHSDGIFDTNPRESRWW